MINANKKWLMLPKISVTLEIIQNLTGFLMTNIRGLKLLVFLFKI